MPKLKINQFYGGISQDDEFFGGGQCIFSSWISHYKDPRYLRLDTPLEVVRNDLNGEVTSIFTTGTGNSSNNDLIFAGTDQWDIFDTTQWATAVFPTGGTSRGGIVFGSKLYFAVDDLYSINVSDTDESNWDYIGSSLASVTNATGQSNMMVNYLDSNLFAVGVWPSTNAKNIGWVDSGLSWQELFEEDLRYDILGITIISNTLRVYTTQSLTIVDLWSLTVIDTVDFPFQVRSVINAGNIDYITGQTTDNNVVSGVGYMTWLYVCSWLEYQRIFFPNNSASLTNFQSNVTDYSIDYKINADNDLRTLAIHGDVIYFAWQEGQIYSYGTLVPWLPPTLSTLPIVDSEWESIEDVNSLFSHRGVLWIGYQTSTKNKLGRYKCFRDETATTRASTWFWMSQRYDMWERSRKKHLQEIRVGKSTATDSVMYIRTDGGDWTELATLNESDRYQRVVNPWYDFYEIEIAMVLSTSTEKISEIELTWDYVQE